MEPKPQSLFDRIFRNAEGKVVIGQRPNAPLITWFVASLLQRRLPNGGLKVGAGALAFGALFVWSSMEFLDGVNLFRRALGLFVLLGMVASRARQRRDW